MKKTININLNSTAFSIDEDAYAKLEGYLDDVRSRLDSEDAEEVMRDIEARVGELFTERLGRYRNVVELDDVQAVMERLGSPDTFGEAKRSSSEERRDENDDKKVKSSKLYRDEENKVVAGVCSGVAHRLGWSIVGVRLLTILLFCMSFGFMMVVYAVLWMAVPEAKTVAQKLEMQGVEPSLQNISDYSRNNLQEETKPKGRGLIATMFYIMGVLFVVMLLAIVAFTVIVTIMALFGVSAVAFGNIVEMPELGALKYVLLLIVSLLVVMIIAIVYIVKLIRRGRSTEEKPINIASLAVWIVIALTAIFAAIYSVQQIRRNPDSIHHLIERLDDAELDEDFGSQMTEIRCQDQIFDRIDATKLDVYLTLDTQYYVELSAPERLIGKVETHVTPDGTLVIDCNERRISNTWVTVHCPGEFKAITLSAGSEMHAGRINGKRLDIDLSSAAGIDASEVKADTIAIEASSGADAEIERANTLCLKVNASSGADVEINNCESKTTMLDASSGADIEIDGNLGAVMQNASSGADIELRRAKFVSITDSSDSDK